MAQPTGLCSPWVTADELPDSMFGDLTEDEVDQAATFASEVLYVLSNRYWPGVCDRLVRPDLGLRSWRAAEPGGGAWTDARWPGWWGASSYGWYGPRVLMCDAALTRFTLPGPVQSVTEIMIDGDTLDPSAYLVEGRSTLVRVDGDSWPTGQDLTRATSSDESGGAPAWHVAYEWGEDPPSSGVLACRSLLVELLTALGGDCDSCRLPWAGAVASVSRKGTSVNYGSLHDQFANGYVGLADVDLWLNTARGGQWRPRRARIGRADARPRNQRVTVWP